MDMNLLSFVCKFDLLLSTLSQDILNGATVLKLYLTCASGYSPVI